MRWYSFSRICKLLFVLAFAIKIITLLIDFFSPAVKESNDLYMNRHHEFFKRLALYRHRVVVPTGNKTYNRNRTLPVWPEEDENDRIEEQMKLNGILHNGYKNKIIYVYTGLKHWGIPPGRKAFSDQKCLVDTCELSESHKTASYADAILFRNSLANLKHKRPPYQIWILHFLESPFATPPLQRYRIIFNWTATYRRDSDIVTPYERFHLNNPRVKRKEQPVDYARGKTKKVAWFVSNCKGNNQRMKYARELEKFIQVDIYGGCGRLKCPRWQMDSCFHLLKKQYKFYLSFENANCRDYITEKFFINGLGHDVVPIVMGAAPEDYERAAPYHSYIHVDDFDSPKELADYLHKLDQNDTLYNEYFQWKGTGEFINTFFWCRVCAMLHDPQPPRYYDDINAWWRGPGICTNGKWPRRNVKKG